MVCTILTVSTFNSIGTEAELRPLVAYKERVIPDIDGILSLGEWNDTETYYYFRNNTNILDSPTKLQCAIKHDMQWLYIMIKILTDDSDGIVTLLTTTSNQETYVAESAYVVFPNGTVKDSTLARTGIFTNWSSSPNVEAKSSYINNEQIFEMRFDKSYLNITNGYSLFNIEYTNAGYGIGTIAIGDSRYALPGLILSSSYYYYEAGEDGIDQWSFDLYQVIVIMITVISICVIFMIYRNRRTNKKQQTQESESIKGNQNK